MKTIELKKTLKKSFDFPPHPFTVHDNDLYHNQICLKELCETYGTPLKVTYLPLIEEQITKAKHWFNSAIDSQEYAGNYHYGYCTKSSHFSFVMDEVLKQDCFIETSSTYDIVLVKKLFEKGKIDKNHQIVCNGFKSNQYLEHIAALINNGFKNVFLVIDDFFELEYIEPLLNDKINVGIRVATDEDKKKNFNRSRLGIPIEKVVTFYLDSIRSSQKFELKMLHFFVNSGISDNSHYQNQLNKLLNCYTNLKKMCPTLYCLNIGGGLPVESSLNQYINYQDIISNIVKTIKENCDKETVPHPDIYTEFGTFTVAKSGMLLLKVLSQKQQNDNEKWNIINSSFITTLPDSWAISKGFLVLALNHWEKDFESVLLGGITCDGDDYYNNEQNINYVNMPKYSERHTQYIGFFNVGAYQDSLSGFGGIKHCLIPSPKHIIIDKNNSIHTFAEEQKAEDMLSILGY